LKKVGKLNGDKKIIEENKKDFLSVKNYWNNNKDPDIYESELNLSGTDIDDNEDANKK
jgi:hypothetical protein